MNLYVFCLLSLTSITSKMVTMNKSAPEPVEVTELMALMVSGSMRKIQNQKMKK